MKGLGGSPLQILYMLDERARQVLCIGLGGGTQFNLMVQFTKHISDKLVNMEYIQLYRQAIIRCNKKKIEGDLIDIVLMPTL